ncbi:hypothetical protein ABT340_39790 [Streptosporangium sp. NPDC000239]|uniref:hypothetical protein n=1 Tax=Streptosporangium sp. NPDC000239 TaxID=3154248 RepID=UPI003332D254
MKKITEEELALMREIMSGCARHHQIATEIGTGKRPWEGGNVHAQAGRELSAEDRRNRTK